MNITTNAELAKIEASIENLINKMYLAKETGNYLKIANYRVMFNKLVDQWQAISGEPLTDNARAYNKIASKLK